MKKLTVGLFLICMILGVKKIEVDSELKDSTVLKFSSKVGFLELVSFNYKSRKCYLLFWENENLKHMKAIENLSDEECSSLGIIDLENSRIFISYVSDEGRFLFKILKNFSGDLRNFEEIEEVNFFKEKILDKKVDHSVLNFRYSNGDYIMIYAKSKNNFSNFFPRKILLMKLNALSKDHLQGEQRRFDLWNFFGLRKSQKIDSIDLKGDKKKDSTFGIWITLTNGDSFFSKIKPKNFFSNKSTKIPDFKIISTNGSPINLGVSMTKNQQISASFNLKKFKKIFRFCKPKKSKQELTQINKYLDLYSDCIILERNYFFLGPDEYVASFSVTNLNLVVLQTKSSSSLSSFKTLVFDPIYSLDPKRLPPKINIIQNRYTAGNDGLFEIEKKIKNLSIKFYSDQIFYH